MQFYVSFERAFCISVETVLIRIVGDDHMELTQGRPFGFEVECVTADGELTQGQLLVFFYTQTSTLINGYGHIYRLHF